MKLIIDIKEKQYEFIKRGMSIRKVMKYPALMEAICEYIASGTPIPDNATNGDVLEIIFPRIGAFDEWYDEPYQKADTILVDMNTGHDISGITN